MPPERRSQIEAQEMHHGKGLDVRLSLALALITIQITVRFSSVPPPQYGGRTWSGVYHLSSPATNLTRGLAALRPFRVPPCRLEPRPYGTVVSVANYILYRMGGRVRRLRTHIGLWNANSGVELASCRWFKTKRCVIIGPRVASKFDVNKQEQFIARNKYKTDHNPVSC
ncbi:hypothetical protein TNCV_2705121 [Trichonephila clavipes]|nr:hypothetical protein TNCV_2705121 [Trichonephila clavipes]